MKSLDIEVTDSTKDYNYNSTVSDYFALMKPRVMSLVVFTAFCGLWLAPGTIHPIIGFAAIFFIALGAGAAGAINMWYDRDIDAIMERTKNRPIIKKNVPPDEALAFGIITAIFSVLMTALCVNIISSILLASSIAYYVFIYTIWLKRSSIYNVVIGGASGALPPIIGWTSVTSEISIESITLFLIIFLWTPPHSWALALFRSDDYKKCNIPMMPVIKGSVYTKKQMLVYTILMCISTTLPYMLNMVNIKYFIIAMILNIVFIKLSLEIFFKNDKADKKLFLYSILYLTLIFIALIACKY